MLVRCYFAGLSVGDSSGDPGGGFLDMWHSGGHHHYRPHLETGKERIQSWWVTCSVHLNAYSSSCEIMIN